MKLRICENHIRLRLKPSEVTELRDEGKVEDTLWFGSGIYLAYGLKTSRKSEMLETDFSENRLSVYVPKAWVEPWAESDQDGFEGIQPLSGGGSLRITVEKDYKCLHRSSEPGDQDVFPHPQANEA